MDDSIWSALDVIFIGAGLYMLYAWFLMVTKGEIKTSLLMSSEVKLDKCKNLKGYKAYIGPRMLAVTFGLVIYGAAGLVDIYVTSIPSIIYSGIQALAFAILIWFGVSTHKSVQKFW